LKFSVLAVTVLAVIILGIAESWTHSGIDNAEIEFVGYAVFRKDRVSKDKNRGGGVLLYIRDTLVAEQLDTEQQGGETVWVKIGGGVSEHIVLGVCYKSPTANREEVDDLYKEIRKYSQFRNLVLMGDFNFGEIDWVNNLGGSRGGQEFIDLVGDCFLTQKVMMPTRGSSILDLVLCTEPDMVDNIEVGCPVANSDHNIIEFHLDWGTEGKKKSVGENCKYLKGNYRKIRGAIKAVKW